MFDGIVMSDLRWLVPLAVGAACLVAAVVQVVRGRIGGWATVLVLVLSTALIGAGVFSKLSVNRDGVIVEMASAAARNVGGLEEAVRINTSAIAKLTERVNELATAAQTSPLGQANPDLWRNIIDDSRTLQLGLEQSREILDSVARDNDHIIQELNDLQLR